MYYLLKFQIIKLNNYRTVLDDESGEEGSFSSALHGFPRGVVDTDNNRVRVTGQVSSESVRFYVF